MTSMLLREKWSGEPIISSYYQYIYYYIIAILQGRISIPYVVEFSVAERFEHFLSIIRHAFGVQNI